MEKLKEILDKLKRYKYPSIFIVLFIVFGLFLNNIALFIISAVVMALVLIFINKDNITTMIAIGNDNSGKHDQALKMLKKQIDNNTKNATAYAYYGNALLLEDKADLAIPILEKGLTLKYNTIIHKNLVLSLSSCYWVKGDIKKSIELLENLKSVYAYLNASVLATLGYLYLLDDNTDKAILNTELALDDNPDSSSALDNMGQIEFKLENFEKAKEYFEKALVIKENLVDSLYYLGCIYINENEKEKAKSYLEKALNGNFSVMNTVTKEMCEEKLKDCES